MAIKPTYEELQLRVKELEVELGDSKQTKEILHEAQDIRQLLKFAPFGVYLIDLSGKIVACNQSGAERLGKTIETAIGTLLRDYFSAKVSENRRLKGMEAIQLRKAVVFEDQAEGRWYRNSIFPIFDEEGRPVRLAIYGSDVTEYKDALDALEKSEEKYKQLSDSLPQVVFETDESGNIIFANRVAFDLFGYTRDDYGKGLSALQMLIPEDRERAASNIQKALRGEKFGGTEYTALMQDGRTYPIMLYSNPVVREGNAVGLRGIIVDLTKVKRVEKALRQSEEKYRRIYENSVVGFFESTPEGRFLHVNPALAKILRYESPEDLVSSVYDIASRTYVNPADRKLYHEALKANGYVEDFQFKARCKDGSEIWISDSSRAYFDGDGEIMRYEGIVVDITERRQVEDALRTERERFRILSANAPFGMVMIDRDGTFRYINPQFKEIFGYDLSDIPNGRTWFNKAYPDPDDRHQAIAAWLEDLAYSQVGQKRPRVFEVECKDGSKKIINFMPVQLETGENLMACEDITSRKEAEAALKRSEAKYRSIFDNAQAAIFRTRISDGKLLECNDRFAQIFGYDNREECIADYVTADHYVDPGTRERMLAELEKFGEVNDFEARFFRKDGSILCTRFSARAYPEEDLIGGVGYDITREKDAIEELRVGEEKYRSILESIEEGYYEVDIAGNLTFFNDSVCEMFGYAEDELMGMNYRKYTAEENAESVYKTFNRVFMTGVPARGFDWEVIRKDGKMRSIEVSVSPKRDAEGTVAGFSGIVRDVTEKRMLQFQLQRAQKMEALGLLAGGVAHDLNNILSGIVSYPELILMDLPEDSPLRKPIKTIHASGMRAADVVADLLTIARGVATGKRSLNLNSIVNEYLGSPEYQNLEVLHPVVHFKTDLALDLLNIRGSSSHLRKTLMNLVTNAMEAIDGVGTVTISTFNRYLDEPLNGYDDVRRGEYVVLSVSDNGRGISSKDLDRIFEPFYTKKVMGRSGTGLGLAVVWNTVQDHNGYINVQTGEEGTTFDLYFPVTREEITEKKDSIRLEEYRGQGEKILVVDDEESQREIATGILSKLGYHADAVSSGEEAIEYVRTNPVDLIVLDMVMPKGMNGRETYQEIIKVRPRQKAIIASGYAKTDEVDAAQKLGAGKYVKKPYTLEKIGIAVKGELGK